MQRVHDDVRVRVGEGERGRDRRTPGECARPKDVAKDVGCDRTYVGRMLHLTSLVPDIIEAILRGDEPDGLSMETLPVRWEGRVSVEWRPNGSGISRRVDDGTGTRKQYCNRQARDCAASGPLDFCRIVMSRYCRNYRTNQFSAMVVRPVLRLPVGASYLISSSYRLHG